MLEALTARERKVLDEVTRGFTNQQIATELGISARTVANHLYNAYAKLGVASRTEAALLFTGEGRSAAQSVVGDAGLEPTTSSV